MGESARRSVCVGKSVYGTRGWLRNDIDLNFTGWSTLVALKVQSGNAKVELEYGSPVSPKPSWKSRARKTC